MVKNKFNIIYDTFIKNIKEDNVSIADIGSDHGKFPIFIKKMNPSFTVYATENKKGPFEHLCNNISASGIDVIPLFRVGLKDLPSSNYILMTGIGGKTISEIMLKGKDYLEKNKSSLILEPQSHNKIIHETLVDLRYKIDNEFYYLEHGHAYPIIFARYFGKREILDDDLIEYGEFALKSKDPFLKEMLINKVNILKKFDEKIDEADKIENIIKKYY